MAGKSKGSVQIKEIAERLNLSAGTVSIVLNGRGDAMRISKETQKRVQDAAKEMNYQPNIYARRLRSAGSEEAPKVIAVFWNSVYSDFMMGGFFRGLHNCVERQGFRMEFYVQMFKQDELEKLADSMTPQRFSAIIICGLSDHDSAFLNSRSFDLPVMVLFRSEEKYHSVYGDDYAVGKNMAKLLASHGHKKVGVVGCSRRGRSGILRNMGFLEVCAQSGIEVRKQWMMEMEERDCDAGYQAMREILRQEERPTAIFSAANEQTLGIVIACREAGVNIPEDLELLAYGDNSAFAYFTPTISAVHMSVEKLAEAAVTLLETIIDNNITIPMGRMIQAEYVFRESCRGFGEE